MTTPKINENSVTLELVFGETQSSYVSNCSSSALPSLANDLGVKVPGLLR